jgi:hypothetical protein
MLQGSFLLIKIQALYWPGKLKKKEHFVLVIGQLENNLFSVDTSPYFSVFSDIFIFSLLV